MKKKTILNLIAFILSFVMITFTIPNYRTFALVSGKCGDNVSWVIAGNQTLIISGSGDMYDYSYDSVPWYSYRNSLGGVQIWNGVTSIGDYSFALCTALSNITIMDTVESIGDFAFSNCSFLSGINIPNSVTSIGKNAFYYCSSLIEVNLPNNLTSIGRSAFFGCTALKNIEVPRNVLSIGKSAFNYCTSIESLTVSKKNAKYHSNANCIIDTNEKKIISACSNAIIPDDGSVTSIGDYAFIACASLTNLEVPASVSDIGNWAFSDCTSLKSIAIPKSVTIIKEYSFNGCKSLENITINSNVTQINKYAFLNCHSLKNIYYSGTPEQKDAINIDNYENSNTKFINSTWHYNCTSQHAKALIKIDEMGETLRTNYLKVAIQKKSTSQVSDSAYNLRLISMLDCLSDYTKVGFYITIAGYNDDAEYEPIKYSTDMVYTSFLNGGVKINASDYGARYFTIVNITIPHEYYSSNITIKPYITFTDGTEFDGNEITTTISKYIK